MTAAELVAHLCATPYRAGGNALDGCDCWGLVEIWHRVLFGRVLDERGGLSPGPGGLAAGHAAHAANWLQVDAPLDHDLALLRAGRLPAGHCGIIWRRGLLHTEERTGCLWQPLDHPLVAHRLTGFLRHP